MVKDKEIPNEQIEELFETLKARFAKNKHRHEGLEWVVIQTKLEANAYKINSLYEMEATGGEPDVVVLGSDQSEAGDFYFYDCSKESPKGRRSVCYDEEARKLRKKYPPEQSALGMAAEMGVEILTEEQYRELQQLEEFDKKTSSWLATPKGIRALGGAIFGDFRYGKVFIYHNGADSYYGSRGFRVFLKV